jgi:hypothetical protein
MVVLEVPPQAGEHRAFAGVVAEVDGRDAAPLQLERVVVLELAGDDQRGGVAEGLHAERAGRRQ